MEGMKEAVGKRTGSSKSTVTDSTRSAAEVVHMTAEKVKESMCDEEDP